MLLYMLRATCYTGVSALYAVTQNLLIIFCHTGCRHGPALLLLSCPLPPSCAALCWEAARGLNQARHGLREHALGIWWLCTGRIHRMRMRVGTGDPSEATFQDGNG